MDEINVEIIIVVLLKFFDNQRLSLLVIPEWLDYLFELGN
jgi:hypothetical protein